VGVQLNVCFARASLTPGKQRRGRTIFPASRIRLSQKMSSALFRCYRSPHAVSPARFIPAGTGSSSLDVVKLPLLASTAEASITIRSDTLRTSPSSVLSIFNWNGPTSRISPDARASFSSTGLPLSLTGFSDAARKDSSQILFV